MHEKILGILGSGYPDVKTIMKHYRMKLNESSSDLGKFSESALILMQFREKGFLGMNLSDEVFHEMLTNANFKNGIFKISIRGFKPISHNGIFKILKKKFGEKNKGCVFDTDSCEIPLNFIQLPMIELVCRINSLKILGSSTVEGTGFTIKGESAILFVLFHMPTIIVQFMKQIPEKIENCYSTPGATSKQSLEDK